MVESFAQYYFVLFRGGEIRFASYQEAGFFVAYSVWRIGGGWEREGCDRP